MKEGINFSLLKTGRNNVYICRIRNVCLLQNSTSNIELHNIQMKTLQFMIEEWLTQDNCFSVNVKTLQLLNMAWNTIKNVFQKIQCMHKNKNKQFNNLGRINIL